MVNKQPISTTCSDTAARETPSMTPSLGKVVAFPPPEPEIVQLATIPVPQPELPVEVGDRTTTGQWTGNCAVFG